MVVLVVPVSVVVLDDDMVVDKLVVVMVVEVIEFELVLVVVFPR